MTKLYLALVFVMVVGVAGCAPAPVEESPYDDVIAQLTELIEAETARLNIPSLSIALVDGRDIVWQRGFGVQNAAEGIPSSENTVYRVGSITKMVTATAVAQAAERGLVDLDAPITDYIPELVFEDPFDSKQAITLRHLLAHRAGILRESPVGNYFDTSFPGIEKSVRSIIGTELIHPVGSTTKYSNMGCPIAALALERVTGVPFAEYMQNNILDPIGMSSSAFLHDEDVVRANLADAFMVGFDGSYFPAPVFDLGDLAAGNLYSTVGDLSRFIMMFFDGGMAGDTRILSSEMVAEMMTPQFPEDGGGLTYGIGFLLGDLDGRRLVMHSGGIYGFTAVFAALPDDELAVVMLVDVDFAYGPRIKITTQALRLMLDKRTGAGVEPLPEVVDLSASELEVFVGKYLSEGRPAFVFVEDGVLNAQIDGVTTIYRPLSDGSFIADGRRVYGASLTFTRGEGGVVVGLEAGGRAYERVRDYTPDRSVPAKWRSFVGDYGWPHNVMRISVLDGELWCWVEWHFEYPMIEVGDGVFEFPDYGLYSNEKLRFERDADGTVTGADMATVPFPRISNP
jgi:CubicO group peptidase (beta-lactamase class C family)